MEQEDSLAIVSRRLLEAIQELDRVTAEVEAELETHRADRQEWFFWHQNWKTAWLTSPESKQEMETLRFQTSASRREKIRTLRTEILSLYEELQTLKSDSMQLSDILHSPPQFVKALGI